MPEVLRNTLNVVSGLLTRALVSAFPIVNILFILTAAGFGVMLHRRLSNRYRDVIAMATGGVLAVGTIRPLSVSTAIPRLTLLKYLIVSSR